MKWLVVSIIVGLASIASGQDLTFHEQQNFDWILELEEKLDNLDRKIAAKNSTIQRLTERVASLEAASVSTDAVLTSLPVIQQIVFDNHQAYLAWTNDAKKVMEWNHFKVSTFQEQLDTEIASRDDVDLDSDWHWIRRFEIAGAKHAELALQHFDILNALKRVTGRTHEIRGRNQ